MKHLSGNRSKQEPSHGPVTLSCQHYKVGSFMPGELVNHTPGFAQIHNGLNVLPREHLTGEGPQSLGFAGAVYFFV